MVEPREAAHPGREALQDLVEQAVAAGITPLGGPHAYDATLAAQYRSSAVLALFTRVFRFPFLS